TLFSENFESYPADGSFPTGWNTSDSSGNLYASVQANPSSSGNPSNRVFTFTTAGVYTAYETPAIDLTGHTSDVITLSFDLYVPSSAPHQLLIGFGPSGTGPSAWSISDPNGGLGGTTFSDAVTAASTWEHFSINITPQVGTFLGSSAATDFHLFIENWNSATLPSIDNLALTATSAVPEPSTYAALAGLASLGFVVVRRRTTARLLDIGNIRRP
ncbi:MAG: PEP-CTERM sorting domain-containing protein, partial [Opitutales bacterium]